MTHMLKVRAVLSAQSEPLGDGTYLGPRIIQSEFLVPLDGGTQGWHHQAPFPVMTSTFELQGPNIQTLIADTREAARSELLDELAQLTMTEIAELIHNDAEWHAHQ